MNAEPTWELSGWWRRVGALLIDSILMGLVAGAIVLVGVFALNVDVFDPESGLMDGFVVILVLLSNLAIPTVYYCWMMPATNGQTVGKQALGIRVVREDGQPITAGFAFIRQILVINFLFGVVLSFFLFGLPQLIDYLWPLWDQKNQALHDKAVKSRVVLAEQVAAPPAAQPQPFATAASPGQPPPPPSAPPPPPAPGGAATPYAPPSGFENPVPDDDKK